MQTVKLSTLKVSAIALSDKEPGQYALFSDGRLYMADTKTRTATEIATLSNIQRIYIGTGDGRREGKEHIISFCFHHPFICITERFGVNGALINIETGRVTELKRKDYHSDVSSYSAAFAEIDGHTLFICQTEWNRLDIYDAVTGENLTEREVYFRDSGRKREDGSPIYEQKNYLDYFHSQLIVSPDGKHFLSNGWVWQPYDLIYLFATEEFLESYELCYIYANSGFSSGYNWDRPCAFIDNNTFVVALDDAKKSGVLDEDEEDSQNDEYHQLVFFKTNTEICTNKYKHRWIEPYRKVKCDAFTPDECGEVTGKLYYDKENDHLIAITKDRGAFIISMDGNIIKNIPDIKSAQTRVFNSDETKIGWDYSSAHNIFYTWQDGVGVVERQGVHRF